MGFKLNLGCGNDIKYDSYWINIDKESTDPFVYKMDIEKASKDVHYVRSFGLDIYDVDYVKAHHVLEHVSDLDSVMKWLHSVCVDGAIIDIVVPLANTLWDVANPDHKRRFNHKTFLYYTKDFTTSDLGLFRGFELVSQKLEREPDEEFQGINWIVANLHVILKVIK